MQWIKKIFDNVLETKQRIGFTKFDRIEKYLKSIEKHKLKSKRDLKTATEIRELINYRLGKVKKLYYLNLFLYFGIYFSVFSIIFPNFFAVSELLNLIGYIVGILGTTIFIIAVFISNSIQNLYYQDLNLLTAHYISIYSRNENTGSNLKGAISAYHDFIDFFKDEKANITKNCEK